MEFLAKEEPLKQQEKMIVPHVSIPQLAENFSAKLSLKRVRDHGIVRSVLLLEGSKTSHELECNQYEKFKGKEE